MELLTTVFAALISRTLRRLPSLFKLGIVESGARLLKYVATYSGLINRIVVKLVGARIFPRERIVFALIFVGHMSPLSTKSVADPFSQKQFQHMQRVCKHNPDLWMTYAENELLPCSEIEMYQVLQLLGRPDDAKLLLKTNQDFELAAQRFAAERRE